MVINKNLIDILACPICKGEVHYNVTNQEMICHFDRVAFPIEHDIPIMLITRARRLSSRENEV